MRQKKQPIKPHRTLPTTLPRKVYLLQAVAIKTVSPPYLSVQVISNASNIAQSFQRDMDTGEERADPHFVVV